MIVLYYIVPYYSQLSPKPCRADDLGRIAPAQDPADDLVDSARPEGQLDPAVSQVTDLLGRMPLPLANIRGLIGAEADDYGHRFLPR